MLERQNTAIQKVIGELLQLSKLKFLSDTVITPLVRDLVKLNKVIMPSEEEIKKAPETFLETKDDKAIVIEIHKKLAQIIENEKKNGSDGLILTRKVDEDKTEVLQAADPLFNLQLTMTKHFPLNAKNPKTKQIQDPLSSRDIIDHESPEVIPTTSGYLIHKTSLIDYFTKRRILRIEGNQLFLTHPCSEKPMRKSEIDYFQNELGIDIPPPDQSTTALFHQFHRYQKWDYRLFSTISMNTSMLRGFLMGDRIGLLIGSVIAIGGLITLCLLCPVTPLLCGFILGSSIIGGLLERFKPQGDGFIEGFSKTLISNIVVVSLLSLAAPAVIGILAAQQMISSIDTALKVWLLIQSYIPAALAVAGGIAEIIKPSGFSQFFTGIVIKPMSLLATTCGIIGGTIGLSMGYVKHWLFGQPAARPNEPAVAPSPQGEVLLSANTNDVRHLSRMQRGLGLTDDQALREALRISRAAHTSQSSINVNEEDTAFQRALLESTRDHRQSGQKTALRG